MDLPSLNLKKWDKWQRTVFYFVYGEASYERKAEVFVT